MKTITVVRIGVIVSMLLSSYTSASRVSADYPPPGGRDYYYCVRANSCAGISLASCDAHGFFCSDNIAKTCENSPSCVWNFDGVCMGPALATCWSNPDGQTLALDCIGHCSLVQYNQCICGCGSALPGSGGVIVNHPDCFSEPFAELP